MISILRSLAAALALVAGLSQAAPATLYDNTGVDLFTSLMYSGGGYTQIGDQVQLSGAGQLGSVSTQFFNQGDDAHFNASLRFYTADGSNTQIGSTFTLSNLFIGAGTSLDVSFGSLGGINVPADLLVLFSVDLVDGQGDLGLNLFDGASVGSSDHGFMIADTGSGPTQISTLMDIDNLYLLINGPDVTGLPEPGTALLVLLPLAALTTRRRR